MKLAVLATLTTSLAMTSSASALGGAGGTLVFNPGNGHHYEIVQTTVSWDQAKLAAEAASYLGVQGHLVTIENANEDNFVYFVLNNGSTLGNSWLGLYQDMSDVGYSEPMGGWKWVTGEPLTYSNWYANEPNNGGGAEHWAGYWPNDKWNDYSLSDGAVASYVIEYDTAAATPYCDSLSTATGCPCGNLASGSSGCANSTGAGGSLSATGTSSLSSSNLGFQALGLVPDGTSVLFQGDVSLAGGNGLIFGDGLRCVGMNVRRVGVRTTDLFGSANWTPMQSGQVIWNAGDVRRFQVWYSDPAGSPCGSGFNTTNALEVSFLP